jgi:hypothetical protein
MDLKMLDFFSDDRSDLSAEDHQKELKDSWNNFKKDWDRGEVMPNDLLINADLFLSELNDLEGESALAENPERFLKNIENQVNDIEKQIEEAKELQDLGILVRGDGVMLRPGDKVDIKESISIVYDGNSYSAAEFAGLALEGKFDIEVLIDVEEEEIIIEFGKVKYTLRGEVALNAFWVDNDGGDGEPDLVVEINTVEVDTKNIDVRIVSDLKIRWNGEEVDPYDLARGKVSKEIDVDIDEKRNEVTITYDGGEYVLRGLGVIQAFTIDNFDTEGVDLWILNEENLAGDGDDLDIDKAKDITIIYGDKEVGFDDLEDEKHIDIELDIRENTIMVSYDGAEFTLRGKGAIERYFLDNSKEDTDYDLAIYVDEKSLKKGADLNSSNDSPLEIYLLGQLVSFEELTSADGVDINIDPDKGKVTVEYRGVSVKLDGDFIVEAFGSKLDPAKIEINQQISIVESMYKVWQILEKEWDNGAVTPQEMINYAIGYLNELLRIQEVVIDDDSYEPWSEPLLESINYFRDDIRSEYNEATDARDAVIATQELHEATLIEVQLLTSDWQKIEADWDAGDLTAGDLRSVAATFEVQLGLIEQFTPAGASSTTDQIVQAISYLRVDMAGELQEAETVADDQYRSTDSEALNAVKTLYDGWQVTEAQWDAGDINPSALLEEALSIEEQIATLEANGQGDALLLDATRALRNDMKAEVEAAYTAEENGGTAEENGGGGTPDELAVFSHAVGSLLADFPSSGNFADLARWFLSLPEETMTLPAGLELEDTLSVIAANPNTDWNTDFVDFFEAAASGGCGLLSKIISEIPNYAVERAAIQDPGSDYGQALDDLASGIPFIPLDYLFTAASEDEKDKMVENMLEVAFQEIVVTVLNDNDIEVPLDLPSLFQDEDGDVTGNRLDDVATRRISDFGDDPLEYFVDWSRNSSTGVQNSFDLMNQIGNADTHSAIDDFIEAVEAAEAWETVDQLTIEIREFANNFGSQEAVRESRLTIQGFENVTSGWNGTNLVNALNRFQNDIDGVNNSPGTAADAAAAMCEMIDRQLMKAFATAAISGIVGLIGAIVAGIIVASQASNVDVDVDDDDDVDVDVEEMFLTLDEIPGGADNIVNAADKDAGMTVAGTANSSAVVLIKFNGKDFEVNADENGNWFVVIQTDDIPDRNGESFDIEVSTDGADKINQAITIDTIAPELSITSLPGLDGDVLNVADLENGLYIEGSGGPGESIVVSVNSEEYQATVDLEGMWSVTIPFDDLLVNPEDPDLTVSTTATDAAGNVTTINESVAIDIHPPVFLGLSINLETDGDVVNHIDLDADLKVAGGVPTGSNVIVTVNGVEYTAREAPSENLIVYWAVDIPFVDLEINSENSQIEVSVTVTDAAGNETTEVQTAQVEFDDVNGPLTRSVFNTRPEVNLVIDGYSASEVDEILLTGEETVLTDETDFVSVFDLDGFDFDLKGGADEFILKDAKDIKVLGGAGDDTIISDGGSKYELKGEDGVDNISIYGGSDHKADGGKGNDEITVVNATKINIKGGDGDDVLVVDGGSKHKIEGGKGNDEITVVNATKIDIKGGDGDDIINTFGFVEGKLDGGKGNDVFDLTESDEFDFKLDKFELGTDKVFVSQSIYNDLAANWDEIASMTRSEFLLLEEGDDVIFEMGNGRDLVLAKLKFDTLEDLTENQVLDTIFDFG